MHLAPVTENVLVDPLAELSHAQAYGPGNGAGRPDPEAERIEEIAPIAPPSHAAGQQEEPLAQPQPEDAAAPVISPQPQAGAGRARRSVARRTAAR